MKTFQNYSPHSWLSLKLPQKYRSRSWLSYFTHLQFSRVWSLMVLQLREFLFPCRFIYPFLLVLSEFISFSYQGQILWGCILPLFSHRQKKHKRLVLLQVKHEPLVLLQVNCDILVPFTHFSWRIRPSCWQHLRALNSYSLQRKHLNLDLSV